MSGPDSVAGRSVLVEAEEIINGQRRNDYGSPLASFDRIAALWTAYLNHAPCASRDGELVALRAEDVAMLLALLKISRATRGWHRDSLVDLAGYAGCVELIGRDRDGGLL